jgi:hypothetical protein
MAPAASPVERPDGCRWVQIAATRHEVFEVGQLSSAEYAEHAEYPESSRAAVALMVAMLGFVICQVFAPIAWVMGNNELQAIAEGRRPPDYKGLARVAQISGIIGTVLLVMAVLGFAVFLMMGGFATLDATFPD